jgi:hypothetical protein
MALSKIRLEMARNKEFPQGSSVHGYEIVAPLTKAGHIDAEAWHKHRADCRVKRFWGDSEDETGHLVHKPGGSWAFHYDIHGDANDDEQGYRLGAHVFRLGEYVSVREHDEDMNTFRVVSISPLA